MASKVDPISAFRRACDPTESIGSSDPRYVPCDEVRGQAVIEIIERELRQADPARPEMKLFAGHRGVGKSSELLRLKAKLEEQAEGRRPFLAVYFDVSATLDINDLDFPDLLVYTAGEVLRQLTEAKIPEVESSLLRQVWQGLTERIPTFKAKNVGLGAGFCSVGIEIKNRPNARRELREAIEQQSTNLLAAVNDMLGNALARLRSGGKEGLVLIIDGLDKVQRRPLPDGGNTHDRLFVDRAELLASLAAHTVYTVPISLLYSPRFAQLEQTFGQPAKSIPMIRLRPDSRRKVTPDAPGMGTLWRMIEARCQYAGVASDDVFDRRSTGDYLCEMTGGHPRHLLMFIRGALATVNGLPITRRAAESAVRDYANSLLREIPDGFWPELRRFDRPQTRIPKDDDHQMMLLQLHLFEYMNGHPWYEVNPVIRTLPRFRPTGRRSRSR